MKYKHLFGPVPSRRLGISLGIDLVKAKTCNFNCVYCECGETKKIINKRDEYVKLDDIITELKDYLNNNPYLDYVTFSGSGEPTLNSRIGDIVKEIKKTTDCKICLITNSTLLNDDNLINELKGVDLIMPSLDAAFDESFKTIDRSENITLDSIVEGLINLSNKFDGEIYLEIFMVEGVNDSIEELDKFIEIIKKINPTKVQLNSLDRPAPEAWVKPMSIRKLEEVKEYLSKELKNVEIIKKYKNKNDIINFNQNWETMILNMIEKRPVTLDDMSQVLGINKKEISKYLDYLEKGKNVSPVIEKRGIFYKKN